MDERLKKIKETIQGWTNYYKIGYWKGIAGDIDAHIRFRLRMCIWKQWKKIGTKKKELIKLGISKQEAWRLANSRKSYARCASSFLSAIITNGKTKQRGLVSLLDQYNLKHC